MLTQRNSASQATVVSAVTALLGERYYVNAARRTLLWALSSAVHHSKRQKHGKKRPTKRQKPTIDQRTVAELTRKYGQRHMDRNTRTETHGHKQLRVSAGGKERGRQTDRQSGRQT